MGVDRIFYVPDITPSAGIDLSASNKQAEVIAYIGRFFLKQNTDMASIEKRPGGIDVGMYIDCTAPALTWV